MFVLLLIACTDGPDTGVSVDTNGADTYNPDTDPAVDSDTGQADTDSGGGDTDSGAEDTDSGGEDTDSGIVDTCSTGSDPPPEPPPSVACTASLPWIDVAAGIDMTCGVKSDGCAECWGANADLDRFSVPGAAFQTIVMSNSTTGLFPHVCGIDVDGAVLCWGGTSGYGEDETPAGTFVSVGITESAGAGVRDDGRLVGWAVRAGCAEGSWSEVVASGDWFAGSQTDGTLKVGLAPDYWVTATGVWATLATGGTAVCGLRVDLGAAVGCVAANDATDITSLLALPPDGGFVDVCVSADDEVCALDTTGTPTCWHAGSAYLADPPPGPFVKLACGAQHACALTAEGSIECWGNDLYGETIPPS